MEIESEVLDIDFDLIAPRESDFQMVRLFCRQLLPDFPESTLSAAILEQPEGRSVAFCCAPSDDDCEIFGVSALLPVGDIKGLADYLGKKVSEPLDLGGAVFFFNERLMNIPPEIAPSLLQQLLDTASQLEATRRVVVLSKVARSAERELCFVNGEEEFLCKYQRPSGSFKIKDSNSRKYERQVFILSRDEFVSYANCVIAELAAK